MNTKIIYFIPVFIFGIFLGFFQVDDVVREDYLGWESSTAIVTASEVGNTSVLNKNNPRCYYDIKYVFENQEYVGNIGTRQDCRENKEINILIHPNKPEDIVYDGRK